MEMEIKKVMVLCYWNGCIKHGPNGVYYEGSVLKVRVGPKTKLNSLLNFIYKATGLDKKKSKLEIFGRHPVVVSKDLLMYVHLPMVNDSDLEIMLEVPSNHPSIKSVELYVEDRPVSDNIVIDPVACSSPLKNLASSSKRQKMQQAMVEKYVGVLKPCLMSSLWIDDHELRVGLCFKDRDELKKAVDWYSIREQRKCITRETERDMYTCECVRWTCKWSLCAAKILEHGLVEITKYTGPHSCCPEDFEAKFVADEIEHVVRVQPTVSIAELRKWWKETFDYELETSKMREGKLEVIKRVFGDEDQSFRVIPKIMSALHSSNGLVMDWQYDAFPNPGYASFRCVFWAFPQSIQGFQHCRPLILVDTRNLNGEYRLKLMIALGVDAANNLFPLAFAVTKEVSTDSWRWFLNGIREKVTQREDICLISSPHPDIIAVINEPLSLWKEPWAYHRFCLIHFRHQFYEAFEDIHLESLVEKAGYSRQKKEFDSYMKDIEKKNPKARKWLDQFPPHQWALAHDNGRRYGIMEMDTEALFAFCRVFSSITVAMTWVVVLLFDELRDAFDEAGNCSRDSLNRGNVYTKPVMDKLEEFITDFATYVITPLDRDTFKVSGTSENYEEWIVQLSKSTCTCGEFQSRKFPCLHALAVCDKLKINPLQYVDKCYTLEQYYKTYTAKFKLVPQVSAWQEASGVPTLFPPIVAPPPPSQVSGDEFNGVTDKPLRSYYRKKARSQRKTFARKTCMIQDEVTKMAEEDL